MKLSFVIPAYNEERRLPNCLDSIQDELSRTPAEVEVIVVDNASTDRTAEVAGGYTYVKVVHEPNKGIVRARQAGYQAATGDVIANIDADTILPEGWLAKVVSAFEKDPELAALSGPQVFYDAPRFTRFVTKLFYLVGYIIHVLNHYVFGTGAMLQGGNFIVRRSYFEKAGGFDTTIEFWGEDTDVAQRIGKVGKVKWTFKLPIYASGRRLNKEGMISAGGKYIKHHFYTILQGKPKNDTYNDIRDA